MGWPRLPDGRSLTGCAHEYTRRGTTTLFAALEVATGLIQTAHHARKRRREFPDFMNQVVAAHPDLEIHVVLDGLSTHKPKHVRWLPRHRNVHFYFTPTDVSWLNQVEVWFSILTRRALSGASHISPREVRAAIDRFVAADYLTATGRPCSGTAQARRIAPVPTALPARHNGRSAALRGCVMLCEVMLRRSLGVVVNEMQGRRSARHVVLASEPGANERR